MKNLTSVLLLFCLLSSTTASFAEIFFPLKVGGNMIMIPIGAISESDESGQTLPGSDEDKDGVRDDVAQNIVAKYGADTAIGKQSLNLARKYQEILSANLSLHQINDLIADAQYINSCIQNETGSKDDGLGFVVPLQLNTVARTRAFLDAARDAYHELGPPNYKSCGNSVSAQSTSLDKAKISSFNPPNLDNYDVYFINGVMTNERDANEARQELQALIKKNPVELLWNQNHDIRQFFDLFVEKIGEVDVDKSEISDFWIYMLRDKLPDAISEPIWWAKQRWAVPGRDVGYWSEDDLDDMIQRIKESLDNNRKTLVISHSQGNFFYRNIWKAIDEWDTDKTDRCFAGIGIAPPLSSKPGNFDYITNSNDKLLNKVRELWPNVLKSNVTVPEGHGDFLGHGLLKTYLDHSEPLNRLASELRQATTQLNESCKNSEHFAESGGQGNHTFKHTRTDTTPQDLQIEFDALSIEDGINVTANGYTLASSSGLVSGIHVWDVKYDPKKHGKEFTIIVDAPYDNTGWNVCIDYVGSNCGNEIERKQVSYSIDGASPTDFPEYVCINHSINGQSVPESGTVQLSKGQHMFTADCWCNEEIYDHCSVFFKGNPRLSLWGASCGSQEECSLYIKNYVMFEVD